MDLKTTVKFRRRLARVCAAVEMLVTLADTDTEFSWIQAKWESRFGIVI